MKGRLVKIIQREIIFVIFVILRIKVINVLLRGLLRRLLPVLPNYFPGKFPVVGEIHVQLPNAKVLKLTSKDGRDSIASRLYWGGLRGHEPETIDLFLHLLGHSSVVFDIGASTGLFALVAAIDHKDRIVHAFEPVPETFNYLVKNIAVNGLHNLKPVCSAVMNYDGEISLYLNRTPALSFSASTLMGFREANKTIVTPVLKIDTYVETNNIGRVDLLKIDTEGADHKVLEGSLYVLQRDKPVIICEVVYCLTDKLLQAIFVDTEYEYFLITDEALVHKEKIVGDETYRYRNYLFIPKSKIPNILQGINVTNSDKYG